MTSGSTEAETIPLGGRGDEAPGFESGQQLARYEIRSLLGSGGMGRVYRAYDPELDREVALKVLRFHHDASHVGVSVGERLVREARAMARLSHPNVLPVFDVAVEGSTVFIAMQFVEGRTLRKWLEAQERDWRSILSVFVAAAAGLQAAHDAHIVHRDFKPTNVLVGDDDRVLVMDFGLARGDEEAIAARSDPSDGPRTDPDSVSGSPMTEGGLVVGTPAYMSPEQHEVRELDGRSDQYSFCVALYEALYGVRPFPGKRLEQLRAAKLALQLQPPPGRERPPRAIRRVLRRGLSPDPADRFASMTELVAALRRASSGSERRVLAVTSIAAVAVLAYAVSSLAQDPFDCGEAQRRIAQVWNDERRVAVARAHLATGLPYAEGTAARVQQGLDERADAWSRGRQSTCEAARSEQLPDAALDGRVRCFDDWLAEFDAMVAALESVDNRSIGRSMHAVLGLRTPGACADEETGEAQPGDPATRERVAEIRKELARAQSLSVMSRPDEALALLEDLAAQARQTGHDPLVARVDYRRGRVLDDLGRSEEARSVLEQSYFLARESGALRTAADTATLLVAVVGADLADPEAWRRWEKEASALIAQGAAPGDAEAKLANMVGMVAARRGRHEEAVAHYERSLTALRDQASSTPIQIGQAEVNYGTALFELRRYDDAAAAYQRAEEIYADTLGAGHPLLGNLHINRGNIASRRGHHESAGEHYAAALEIYETSLGEEHPRVGMALNNLGVVLRDLGRTDEAEASLRRAYKIKVAKHGASHPAVADTLLNIADVAFTRERYGDARKHLEAARAIYETTYGTDHPDVVLSLVNLGLAASAADANDEAESNFKKALQIGRRIWGENHANLASPLRRLAQIAALRQRHEEAVDLFEQALDLPGWDEGARSVEHAETLLGLGASLQQLGRSKEAVEPLVRAESIFAGQDAADHNLGRTRFALGRALWDTGKHDDAHQRVEQAAKDLARAAPEGGTELADARRWLSTHR